MGGEAGSPGRPGICFPKLLTHQEVFPKVPHIPQASSRGPGLGEDPGENRGLSSAPGASVLSEQTYLHGNENSMLTSLHFLHLCLSGFCENP